MGPPAGIDGGFAWRIRLTLSPEGSLVLPPRGALVEAGCQCAERGWGVVEPGSFAPELEFERP